MSFGWNGGELMVAFTRGPFEDNDNNDGTPIFWGG